MHGVRLEPEVRKLAGAALPLLCLNSVTMLGAELFGRSYGGGILKMEPREAAILPMPSLHVTEQAWADLKPHKDALYRQLRDGRWTDVVKRVDSAVLEASIGLNQDEVANIGQALRSLRRRRLGREDNVQLDD